MGELIYILLGLTSVVGLAFIVERGLMLRWNRVVPREIARSLAECRTRDDVKTLCRVCEQKPSPLGRLLLLAANNLDRPNKQLFTVGDAGDPVLRYRAEDERDEAAWVSGEILRLRAAESLAWGDIAVFYRTNAQSRALEDSFIFTGIPYKVVGGAKFYDRREVKDVLAYLRLCVNPRDTVSFARVVNTPRRKIGDRSVAELDKLARKKGLGPLEAAQRLDEGEQALGPAAMTALRGFADLMERLSSDAQRVPLPVLFERVLDETGYREMLQDGTQEGAERWANVLELAGLAGEYSDVPPPDGLVQFLENVALVSDVNTTPNSRPFT